MTRPRSSDERGLTLVETVTVVSLLSLVMAFVLGTFGTLLWTTERTELRLQNLDEARTIINNMTKDIRTATRKEPTLSPFDLADAREIIFYANLDPAPAPSGPRKVRLYVDVTNRLMQEITLPTAPCSSPSSCMYPPTPTTTRVLGYYVVTPGTIFRYYDDSVTPAAEITPVPMLSTDPNLLKISAVQINLTIRKQTNFHVPAATIVNRVRMPNVDYNPIS